MILSTSPFMKRPVDTPAVMRHVIYALTPVMMAAVFFFGIRALLLLLTCALGAAFTEWVFGGRGSIKNSTVMDGSAILTGILLALTLPPGLPLWMAFFGAVVAVVLGKVIFGGLHVAKRDPHRGESQQCIAARRSEPSIHRALDDAIGGSRQRLRNLVTELDRQQRPQVMHLRATDRHHHRRCRRTIHECLLHIGDQGQSATRDGHQRAVGLRPRHRRGLRQRYAHKDKLSATGESLHVERLSMSEHGLYDQCRQDPDNASKTLKQQILRSHIESHGSMPIWCESWT